MITFFESFRLRHSQFHRATPESFLPTSPTANDPPYKSVHYSLFEPKDKFESNNEVSATNVLFDMTEEVIPIAINNKTEEEITFYKNTTLGFFEILPEVVMNNISELPKPLPAPIKNNKHDLNILKKSVDKDIPKRFHDQFGSLVKEFYDIFSKSEWDLGKCDVTTH